LRESGIILGEDGAISVNDFSETNIPSIYAIGDVTNRVNLTPVAIAEAKALVESLFKNNPTSMRYDLIPSAVFTSPEAASVGIAEGIGGEFDASNVEGGVRIFKTSFRPMKNTMTGNPTKQKQQKKILIKLFLYTQHLQKNFA
jgi:glutathione reductase (NADPH)